MFDKDKAFNNVTIFYNYCQQCHSEVMFTSVITVNSVTMIQCYADTMYSNVTIPNNVPVFNNVTMPSK